MPQTPYLRGVLLILMAGVCLSTAGIIVRNIESAGGWQILFYRSLCFCLTVLTYILWTHGKQTGQAFKAIGWPGLLAALSLGCGFTFYLFGLLMTTVANLAFMLSASPFFAAVFGWFILRERIPWITWAAIAVAMAGMAVMFADGIETGLWLGNLVALGAPLTFALMIVLYRKAGDRDMTPATFLGGVVAGLIAFVMAESLRLTTPDLLLAMLLGFVQVGLGFLFITLGARWVPAAQVALLALVETILAPLWVWAFLGEAPSAAALIGGLIVLGAVVAQGYHGIRRDIRRGSAAPAE